MANLPVPRGHCLKYCCPIPNTSWVDLAEMLDDILVLVHGILVRTLVMLVLESQGLLFVHRTQQLWLVAVEDCPKCIIVRQVGWLDLSWGFWGHSSEIPRLCCTEIPRLCSTRQVLEPKQLHRDTSSVPQLPTSHHVCSLTRLPNATINLCLLRRELCLQQSKARNSQCAPRIRASCVPIIPTLLQSIAGLLELGEVSNKESWLQMLR